MSQPNPAPSPSQPDAPRSAPVPRQPEFSVVWSAQAQRLTPGAQAEARALYEAIRHLDLSARCVSEEFNERYTALPLTLPPVVRVGPEDFWTATVSNESGDPVVVVGAVQGRAVACYYLPDGGSLHFDFAGADKSVFLATTRNSEYGIYSVMLYNDAYRIEYAKDGVTINCDFGVDRDVLRLR